MDCSASVTIEDHGQATCTRPVGHDGWHETLANVNVTIEVREAAIEGVEVRTEEFVAPIGFRWVEGSIRPGDVVQVGRDLRLSRY